MRKDAADAKAKKTTTYANMSTTAAFLTGVTATDLQITMGQEPSKINTATIFFWFMSQTFGAQVVLASLLAIAWENQRG